jgi:hypothetical protein
MEEYTTLDRDYIAQNNAERERLRALVERLSDEDLQRPMAAGWTVAAVLAHLVFWDARVLTLLNKLERGMEPLASDYESEDVDWINDAAKPLCLALPPRTAANLALAIAEDVDQRVATLSDDLVAKNEQAGLVNLDTANHRREHLDDIDRYL